MIIPRTLEAIKYYKLASENAHKALENEISTDMKYVEFQEKYCVDLYTVVFSEYWKGFRFYQYKEGGSIDYFKIINAEIIYDNENTFDGIEEVAEKLLKIVKKFY